MHAARAQKFPQNLCVMESALGNIDGVVLDAINQPITYDPIPREGLRPAALYTAVKKTGQDRRAAALASLGVK